MTVAFCIAKNTTNTGVGRNAPPQILIKSRRAPEHVRCIGHAIERPTTEILVEGRSFREHGHEIRDLI